MYHTYKYNNVIHRVCVSEGIKSPYYHDGNAELTVNFYWFLLMSTNENFLDYLNCVVQALYFFCSSESDMCNF